VFEQRKYFKNLL